MTVSPSHRGWGKYECLKWKQVYALADTDATTSFNRGIMTAIIEIINAPMTERKRVEMDVRSFAKAIFTLMNWTWVP